MIAPAPAIQSDDRYAASILAHILGHSEGSRLYWSLVDTGLADEAIAHYDGRDRLGEYYFYASCSPESAGEVEDVLRREAAGFVNSISEHDLRRVRSKIATSVTLAGERPAGRMRRLGSLWLYQGEYRGLEEELERIESVTIDDLHRVAELFPFTPLVTARLRPAAPDRGSAG